MINIIQLKKANYGRINIMELNADKQLVRKILMSKNRYSIPRYQREYSWGIPEISEYYDDIVKQLSFDGGSPKSEDYFIGSILLTGDYNSSGKMLEIVDGQQRLTTITIFLSALAETFLFYNEKELADIIWGYIIGKDDNAKEYPILYNEMQYPYFQYYIQRKEKNVNVTPKCDEEERIETAYKFFVNNLKDETLRKKISSIKTSIDVGKFDIIDILKAVRDQVLDSYVICIWTTEEKYANEIFEILNAKGKQLASVDLIKNTIFKVLDVEIPDDIKIKWKQIKNNLVYKSGRIDFTVFYRHYWISKYSKVSEDKLYDAFKEKIPNTEESYKSFVDDMIYFSEIYVKIVNPKREDYDNRKEYYYLVDSLKAINSTFGVTQVRVALMALYDAKFKRKVVSNKQFKDLVIYLEKFHYAYNAVCSLRSNSFEGIYSAFARDLNKSANNAEATTNINILKDKLDKIFPNYEQFRSEFVKICYSKNYLRSNVLAKYSLNVLDKYYSDPPRETIRDDSSVEHILSEDKNSEETLNIGNLILLEGFLNEKAEDKSFVEKKEVYSESKYEMVQEFTSVNEENANWTVEDISERANKLSEIIYCFILRPNDEKSKMVIVASEVEKSNCINDYFAQMAIFNTVIVNEIEYGFLDIQWNSKFSITKLDASNNCHIETIIDIVTHEKRFTVGISLEATKKVGRWEIKNYIIMPIDLDITSVEFDM